MSDRNTVAVGRTDIPGLNKQVFEGLSPALRREADLKSLDDLYGTNRPIKSPNPNPIASRHVEEDLFNAKDQDIRIKSDRFEWVGRDEEERGHPSFFPAEDNDTHFLVYT